MTSAPGLSVPGIIDVIYSGPHDTVTSGDTFGSIHSVFMRCEEHSVTSDRVRGHEGGFAVTCALGVGAASWFDAESLMEGPVSGTLETAYEGDDDAVTSVSGVMSLSGWCAVECSVVVDADVESANLCPVRGTDCDRACGSVGCPCAAAMSEDGA